MLIPARSMVVAVWGPSTATSMKPVVAVAGGIASLLVPATVASSGSVVGIILREGEREHACIILQQD